MSDYNWCLGPGCHTKETQSRIRGSGDNKVLRTIKIKIDPRYNNNIHSYFCNTRCLYDYLNMHAQAIANIAPRREAQETPIQVKKEKYESYRYDYGSNIDDRPQRVPYMATRTIINSVDNDNG